MNSPVHVATPPSRPHLVFDGDCRFCALWVRRWQAAAGGQIECLPYQIPEVSRLFPELPRAALERAVHLVETDGSVTRGAEAVFRGLAKNPARRHLHAWYQRSPAFARVAEAAYGLVAGHRRLFSWLTRVGWGERVEPPKQLLVRSIFLRSLGIVYLVAFVSFWVQLQGLIGSHGIAPAAQLMAAGHRYHREGHSAWECVQQLPTLCWLGAGDGALHFLCGFGVVLSMLLIVGVAPIASLAGLWAIYLSLSVVGQDFLSFQWDTLLLESGFLALLFAPGGWWPGLARAAPPSRISVWLLRWLLFRLMFQSGVTKLLYGDPTWLHLTALTFHYETQPLPTWIGWYAHQLPAWFQGFSCAVMFVVEIGIPFLFLGPPRLRVIAFFATVGLQILIGLTGNYGFFNALTALLGLCLLDDAWLPAWLRRLGARTPAVPRVRRPPASWRTAVRWAAAVMILLVTSVQMALNCRVAFPWPTPIPLLTEAVAPLRSWNSYGLFRVMTRPRYEIILEGSNDRVHWLPYHFKYKPGDVQRRPRFVEPHQPRLDWQMWFEALRPEEAGPSRWFAGLCLRLFEGQPDVLALLDENPFPEAPPHYLRAVKYEYRFTTWAERRATGAWWKREPRGEYLPPTPRRGW